jgi:hypothetical protein
MKHLKSFRIFENQYSKFDLVFTKFKELLEYNGLDYVENGEYPDIYAEYANDDSHDILASITISGKLLCEIFIKEPELMYVIKFKRPTHIEPDNIEEHPFREEEIEDLVKLIKQIINSINERRRYRW